MGGFPMASADGSPLDRLDKVRLVLDYAPAEALESVADDEEELELLSSLDERLDREVEATRVREETVVLERPQVVELLGVACPDCETAFEVEADGPLPRPQECPECGVEGVLEPHGEAAAFAVPQPEVEEEPEVPEPPEPPEPEESEEEGAEAEPPEEGREPPVEGSFVVPEADGDRVAVLGPAEDAAPVPMDPAVDPVEALTPDDEEPDQEVPPADEGLEVPEPEDEADVVGPAEEDDEEFTFTPPTAQEEEETDEAVQELLDEDIDLETDEEDEDDRSEAFDDVDWPEEDETDDFDVVAPLGEDPEEAPDPEEELVEPEEDPEEEPEWPELDEEEEPEEEPEWPELDDEGDDADEAEDEGDWPELEDEGGDEGEDPASNEASGNPGREADDEIPSEWAGRDLEAEGEEEPSDEPAGGARGGLPVEQIPGVESFYADQLRESGYETTADLHADEAWEVADETGIATGLVEKWHSASALVQELGMGAGYAGLLAEADVDGPDDLADRDAKQLAAHVNELVEDADEDIDPVSPQDASAWLGGA